VDVGVAVKLLGVGLCEGVGDFMLVMNCTWSRYRGPSMLSLPGIFKLTQRTCFKSGTPVTVQVVV